MNSRQQQAKETKTHIMSVASNLIKTHTYDKLSVNTICSAANVSTGAFYHHFKSKQGLIVEGYKNCDDYFNEHVFNELKSTTGIEKIKEYIGFQMEYAIHMGIDLMIQLYKAQISEATDFFLQMERGLPQGLNKLILEAQKTKEITSSFSSEAIANELLLISRGVIYNWCQQKGSYDLKERCNTIITNHLKAFTI